MDTMYPAATFAATRGELLGAAALLGTAEIARGLCRGADRTVSVLMVTADRMRRIDGWLGPAGFVTHAAAPDPDRTVVGSVCDRDRAHELIQAVFSSLTGPITEIAAPVEVELPALDVLAPGTVPRDIDWIVVVTASSVRPTGTPRRTIIAAAGGLLLGAAAELDRGSTLVPVDVDALTAELARAVGPASRSVSDLLLDD